MTRGEAGETVVSFCRICMANCGVLVRTADSKVVDVRGDPDHPLSRGYVCPKGRMLGTQHHDPRRLNAASMLEDVTGLSGRVKQAAPADEVLQDVVHRLREIRALHGRNAVGVYFGTGAGYDWAGAAERVGPGARPEDQEHLHADDD